MSDTSKLAYPITETDKSGQIAPTHLGMTLREHYAGLAMQGLLSLELEDFETVALNAVNFADALIAALQEDNG